MSLMTSFYACVYVYLLFLPALLNQARSYSLQGIETQLTLAEANMRIYRFMKLGCLASTRNKSSCLKA